MARGVNKVILIGNLGKDPELTYTPSGVAIAKFSLATAESRKNQSGGWDDHTEWHNIVLFGKTAETAEKYLKKGGQVFVEGKLSTDTYEKDGITRYFTKVIGFNMQMLGSRDSGSGQRDSGGGDNNYRQQPAQRGTMPPAQDNDNDGPDDDLPF